MLYLLPRNQYPAIQPLLIGLDSALIIKAVLEGTSPGSIWVDDITNPTSGLLETPEGKFLVGNPQNARFNDALKAHLTSLHDDYLVLEYDDNDWPTTLNILFEKRIVLEPRLYYQFEQSEHSSTNWRDLIPSDMQMLPVDPDFLQHTGLKNMPAVLDATTSNFVSQDEFFKLGFGRCLVHDNTIVSWCMADCMSGTRCEIGIHTDPAYRKQGYAALTVRAAIEAAASVGLTTIGWHCWEHNIGSQKVAEKVGFKLMHSYPAHVCLSDDTSYAIEVGANAARAGNHRDALKSFQSAGESPWAYFLAARSHAALEESEATLQMLHKALDAGWSGPEYLIADVFKPLYTLPGWQRLLADPRLQTKTSSR